MVASPSAPRVIDPAGSAIAGGARRPRPEQSRALEPDETGVVTRDGVRVTWWRYGAGSPTILLLPTWTIVHSRFWKAQIPYLARHFRVVTFDGRGNGHSDRPTESRAYDGSEFVADALAVMDATGTDRAVVAGLSKGANYALMLAGDHPERVLGAVYVGSALPLVDRQDDRDTVPFDDDVGRDEGWARFNAFSWRRDWPGFVEFFFNEVFSEAHSTKHVEDALGWAFQTDPETMITAQRARPISTVNDGVELAGRAAVLALAARSRCPSIVLHGTDDRIIPVEVGRRLADLLQAPLIAMEGSGHDPCGREPVVVNLAIRELVRSLGELAR